jgi:predicted AAA+ superfamily ATPase
VEYFWDGDVVPKRGEIDFAGLDVVEKPRFAYRGLRYFAHRGLHRFQAEHWDLDDWKRELDWCLKKRFNLFMLRTGIDDLFQRAFPGEVPHQPILALVRWFESNVLQGSPNALAERGEPVCLFFDEVQNLNTWAPQLKSLVDHTAAKTLVTGSSALRIAHGEDSLAGRISMIELGPLRLNEIAGVRQLGDLPPFQPSAQVEDWMRQEFWLDLASYAQRHVRVLKKAFEAFSDVGGYPVCHKPGANRSELGDLIKATVVDRTLVHDLRAGLGGRRRDPRVLEETFRRVCRYAGQSVRPRFIAEEVTQVLGPGVREKSVYDAIQFLANALLVHEIPPLEALTRRQSHPAKLCLCDHFVREVWLQETVPIAPGALATANQAVSTTAGHLMESVVGYYLKGIPGADASWFPERKQEPEVDFLLTIGLQRIPMEVKYRRGNPDGGDLGGLRAFCGQTKYNAPFGLLITQEFSRLVAKNIIAIPAYAFLSLR